MLNLELLLSGLLLVRNRRLVEVGSLNLFFYFIILNSFNLLGLSNIFSFLLGYIFGFLYRYIFCSLYRYLFFYCVVNCSGNVFFLVFNCLVISHNFLFGYCFINFFFYSLVFDFGYSNLLLNSFFYLFVFNFFSFYGEIFDSGFSFNCLRG